MKKKLISKKFLIIFILLFIFFVGLFARENKKKKELTEAQLKFLSEPENLDFIFKIVEEERDRLKNIANIKLKSGLVNLSIKRTDIEAELIKLTAPLLNNIKIDKQKTEGQYAQEYVYNLNKIKNLNIDFSNKQSIFSSGELLYEIAQELSLISVPPAYEEVHKSQVLILGTLGNALKNLALTDDYEKGVALMQIINNLIDEEKKLAEKINR
jgi:hypothetical protein